METSYVASQTKSQADLAEIIKIDLTNDTQSVFATTGIEGIYSVTFDSGGDLFASSTLGGASSKVTQYDGQSGTVIGTFVPGPVASPAPGGIVFGPNGNLFVGEHGEIREYDGLTGALVGVFASGNGLGATNGLAFAPNGNLLVADVRYGIFEFDGDTGVFVREFATNIEPNDLAFGPTGEFFVSSSGEVLEYDWLTGQSLGFFAPGAAHGITIVPEPSTGLLLGLGLVGLGLRKKFIS